MRSRASSIRPAPASGDSASAQKNDIYFDGAYDWITNQTSKCDPSILRNLTKTQIRELINAAVAGAPGTIAKLKQAINDLPVDEQTRWNQQIELVSIIHDPAMFWDSIQTKTNLLQASPGTLSIAAEEMAKVSSSRFLESLKEIDSSVAAAAFAAGAAHLGSLPPSETFPVLLRFRREVRSDMLRDLIRTYQYEENGISLLKEQLIYVTDSAERKDLELIVDQEYSRILSGDPWNSTPSTSP